MPVDLHTHSSASDGFYSPSELMEKASEAGLSAIALSDHDTVEGLREAGQRAGELGLRFIKAIELEISFSPGEFHLLGMDLQKIDDEFLEMTGRLRALREARNRKMVSLLIDAGLDADYEEFLDENSGRIIGRPHIADLMVKHKLVKNRQAAFDKYLGNGRPFYIPKGSIELREAISQIHRAGGLAIVAHPLSLFVGWQKLAGFMLEWKELGIDGIEAWHPAAKVRQCRRLELMGAEHGFRLSAGSDYHGPHRPDRRLGYTAGGRKIPEEYLELLKR